MEDKAFIRFILYLNPSFKMPNREQITNKHLVDFYKLIVAEVELILAEIEDT